MEKTPDYVEGKTRDPRNKAAPAKPEPPRKHGPSKDDGAPPSP